MNWLYFSEQELQCHCGCGKAEMDHDFMKKLIALREQLGFSLVVTSGYRCSKHNQNVSKTGANGPHTTGRAVDIAISGGNAFKLLQYAASFQIQGIGIKQSGLFNQRFIHLDDLTEKDKFPRPMVWSY